MCVLCSPNHVRAFTLVLICTVHQIHHVIVKYTSKSLLHHLKNNLSQEDTWLDNCVRWLGCGMLKAGPAWEQPEPPPISKPKEPMARCTHRGYLRELTSDHITIPWSHPTVRASKGSTLKPLHRALDFKVRSMYPLLNSSADHRCYFRRLHEIILYNSFIILTTCYTHSICILQTLRWCWLS